MEDEDEVDVEGDFDINIGMDQETIPNLYIDINEPPSKSANLLPEYTQHPWMLEQGWNLQLDHVADEKSKAAIEKMLQEEQQYINGKVTATKVVAGVHSSSGIHKPSQQKRAWTEEERVTFLKGLEIYGRSWSKIADLIPGKTVQQVKSFGQHYFKMKAREEEELRKKEQKSTGNVKTPLPIGIQNAIRAVTTAQPTVKVSPKKLSTYYSNASSVWTDPDIHKKIPIKPIASGKAKKEVTPRRASPKKKKSQKHAKNKSDDKSKNITRVKLPSSHRKDRKGKELANSSKSKMIEQSNIATGETRVELKTISSLIEGSEVVRIPRNVENESDSSDVDVDIDVETDEDATLSVESANPGMDLVYKKLVESAGINTSVNCECEESEQEDSSDNSSIHNEKSDGVGPNYQIKKESDVIAVSQKLGTPSLGKGKGVKTEPNDDKQEVKIIVIEPVVTSVELSHNLERYPSIGSIFESQHESSSEEETVKQESLSSDQEIKIEKTPDVLNQKDQHTDDGEVRGDAPVTVKREEVEGDDVSKEEQDASIEDVESADSLDEEDDDEHLNEFGILTSLGELVYLPNPNKEVILAREVISDLERKIHCEFFTQKPGAKTPDRYLRIRNFILDAWGKCRPQYLNKTSVRPGLKNCGDVNCIGRIHSYLEQAGAINYGCSQVQYRRTTRAVQLKTKNSKDTEPSARAEFIRVRKRRVRDVQGDWVDEKDLEGKTIEHTGKDVAEKKPKLVRIRSSYDPFKLIPCRDFSDLQPAPYRLNIESRAMVTMDIHAHMSKTEVIGLLGGEYCRDTDVMHITLAVPCESISTGMQCEMDPVSQTVACEAIQSEGQRVVGWYHSHPTFTPNPSCRDIETQEKYQDWFGKGGNPFIGIIVSPYSSGEYRSIVRCLMVLECTSLQEKTGVPYQFNFDVIHQRWNSTLVRRQVINLVEKYSKFTSRVHLLKNYSALSRVTCLEKMIDSATANLPESLHEDRDELRNMVHDIVTSSYKVDLDNNESDKLSENEETEFDGTSVVEETTLLTDAGAASLTL